MYSIVVQLFYKNYTRDVIASGNMGTHGILCIRGDKEYANIRQAIVVCGD